MQRERRRGRRSGINPKKEKGDEEQNPRGISGFNISGESVGLQPQRHRSLPTAAGSAAPGAPVKLVTLCAETWAYKIDQAKAGQSRLDGGSTPGASRRCGAACARSKRRLGGEQERGVYQLGPGDPSDQTA